MKVVIEQRHTVNTTFDNCNDCALDRAIREQHPELINYGGAGGTFVFVDNVRYCFDSSLESGFNDQVFKKLKSGEIKSITLEIPVPDYDNRVIEPKPTERTRTVYVTVTPSLVEQAKVFIENKETIQL